MKLILFILFILISDCIDATVYYVKSSGGNGSGLNDPDAWSFDRLNAMASSLHPGDKILFKRGDTLRGTLTVKSAGSSDHPIVFDAYGAGVNPVVSGFIQPATWTLLREHIYYTSLDVHTLNLVTLDGRVCAMGRYPNIGYLPYTSHVGNESIAGATIGSLPFDPAGAEVVIRKLRWVLDRHPVIARSRNTLRYRSGTSYGHNDLYKPVNGNGYFIQNSLNTLDREGEWYYDTASNRLYMHFGIETPSGRLIKAGAADQNIYINYWSHLVFNNIDFEGGNIHGAYIIGTNHIAFNNCNFRQQGGNGVWASYTAYLAIKGGTIKDVLNNGIYVEQEGNHTSIENVRIVNSGEIAGAGKSGDGSYEGIFIVGNNTLIQNCSVLNSGYIGINFQGNDVLVQRNLVDSFANIKDDGAGIYTYSKHGVVNSNRTIRKNIVLNAIGAFGGAEGNYWEKFGKAAGIYLDDNTSRTTVDSNVVAHGNWGGIFLHNAHMNIISNNLVYDFSRQLDMSQDVVASVRNNQITGNTFIARTSAQQAMRLHTFVSDNVRLFGTFDNNIYARPIDDDSTININNEYSGGDGSKNLTLAEWKVKYARDARSSKSAVITNKISNLIFDYSVERKEIQLKGIGKSVSGKAYDSGVRIGEYGGIVLIY